MQAFLDTFPFVQGAGLGGRNAPASRDQMEQEAILPIDHVVRVPFCSRPTKATSDPDASLIPDRAKRLIATQLYVEGVVRLLRKRQVCAFLIAKGENYAKRAGGDLRMNFAIDSHKDYLLCQLYCPDRRSSGTAAAR